MEVVITVLIIIVSIVMALFVLIQNPKGGGLASGFSGASQIGGVQKTADFLEKGSWAMMIALFVLCIVSASFLPNSGTQEVEQETIENVDGAPDNTTPGAE
ncbi:MAG TPA: preprotein translocase subunit SecG [Flavobacteriales bacterium]|nr:preprotein translocase subunit SecG [Flavobacteriales bacterium]|tara:strand:+ start:4115 stop:4417 length:303 start_codon:yes stop_codon:yes gene_type:complete